MALKLNSSGGGSVTIDAGVTASNYTLILPPSDGSIATTDGSATTFTSITDSGNLTFTGTGNRITGDFSNATLSNRVMFQTSTSNSSAIVSVLPNGSGTASQWAAYSSSDTTNSSVAQFSCISATDTRLNSNIAGTGTYLPMTFYTGGSERMRIDTSGNVGIGTSSPSTTLQVLSGNGGFGGGAGSCATYIGTSGTGNTATTLSFGTGSGSTFDIVLFAAGASPANAVVINQRNSAPMLFQTNNTERMRIDSSGNVGIGTSTISHPLVVKTDTDFVVATGKTSAGTGARVFAVNAAQNAYKDLTIDGATLSFSISGTQQASVDSSANFKFNSGYGSVATAYGCRAWVNFNGTGTVAINASGNVTSITDNGVGVYTVNFTTSMSDSNYSVCGVAGAASANSAIALYESTTVTRSISAVQVVSATTSAPFDSAKISVSIFR